MIKCKDCKWFVAHDKNLSCATLGDGQCCFDSAGHYDVRDSIGNYKFTISFPLVIEDMQCRKGKKKGEKNED